MKIGIVGGGIGGLTAAIALRTAGHEVTVLERAPGFSNIGTGITLSHNAMLILNQLGIADEIQKRGTPLACFRTMSDSGKTIGTVSLRQISEKFGVMATGIHRAVLHEILVANLGTDFIVCDWSLKSASQGPDSVTLTNNRGESRSFDLVIGCDGIHSTLRELILGPALLRDSGQFCWRGTAGRPVSEEDPTAGSVATEIWGAGRRFGVVPIGAETIYWYAVTDQGLLSRGDLKKDLQSGFASWPVWMKTIVMSTADKDIVSGPLSDRTPTEKWYKDRIVFLGDAIHPTTPNMGQGAGMAVESAFTLAHCLGKHKTLSEALQQYFDLRFSRTREVTSKSWTLGKVAQTRSAPLRFVRNSLVSLLPGRIQESALSSFVLKSPWHQLVHNPEIL